MTDRDGRKIMGNGEPDRLPTTFLTERARLFAEATSKKGGPANKQVYGAGKPPAEKEK